MQHNFDLLLLELHIAQFLESCLQLLSVNLPIFISVDLIEVLLRARVELLIVPDRIAHPLIELLARLLPHFLCARAEQPSSEREAT